MGTLHHSPTTETRAATFAAKNKTNIIIVLQLQLYAPSVLRSVLS